MRTLLIAAILLLPAASTADVGGDWYAAFQKGKANVAAKLTGGATLRYGDTGKDQAVAPAALTKHYTVVFRTLRKLFKGAPIEATDCTGAGRELGYMSVEWKSKDEDVAVWIRRIPEQFCGSNAIDPPKVWLIKLLETDLPHAMVLFVTGEDQQVTGFHHF